MHVWRRVGAVLLLPVVALLVSCGDQSGERPTLDPSRSLTDVPSVTATLPSPTRSFTRSPTDTSSPTTDAPTSEPPTTEPTEPPTSTDTDTSAPPTPTPTPTPTRTESEQTTAASSPEREPTPSPSPTPEATETEEDDAESTPTWVWWLVGALVVALAVGVPLLVRARRRSAWQERLTAAEAEVAWFARELVPELRRSASVDRLAGAWAVSSERVVAAEDQLTSLVATTQDDTRRARATELRDAVRAGRTRVESLAVAQDVSELSLDLDEVAAGLEAALRPAAPTP
jgi:hypothetical protein